MVVCMYDHTRWPLIKECLESLTLQTVRPAKVIAVVDGSARLAAALSERNGPEEIVVLPANVGVSAARNAGIDSVRAERVAFLDDDAVATPRWLERLITAIDQTGAVGVCGWVEAWFEGPSPRWLPPELLWTLGCSHRGLPRQRTLMRKVHFGGCSLFRTDVLRQHGGFDPSVGRSGDDAEGGEEAEFCLRVSRRDPTATFVHEPSAVIRHYVSLARTRVAYVLDRCHAEGRSKGRLARRAGVPSLRAESALVLSVTKGCARLVLERRPEAVMVLVAGVAATALGYFEARIEPWLGRRRSQ